MQRFEPTTDTASFAYIHKKSERLAVAIHIITDHLGTEEKLMKLLRETSLSLLAEISSLSSSTFRKKIEQLSQIILKLKSFLVIGYQCGYISEQNFRLLEKEFMELDLFITTHSEHITSPHITQTFLQVPLSKPSLKHVALSRTGEQSPVVKRQNGIRHSERRKVILDLIGEKDRVSVKDVSEVITDCSEKTIQRELLALVAKNVLKKEGERRWSTYSLADSA